MIKDEKAVLIGQAIRNKRMEKELSQQNLATRSGLHRTYIGSIERGEKNCTIKSLVRIAEVIDLTATELLGDILKGE